MNESDSYAQKRLMAVGDIEVVDLAAFLIWILGGKSVLENLDLELSRQSAQAVQSLTGHCCGLTECACDFMIVLTWYQTSVEICGQSE